MKRTRAIAAKETYDEITTLVRQLDKTQRRINELVDGELESVTHPGGSTYLLHQAQEKLRESESHYQALIENMLEGCVYCRLVFEGDRAVDYIYLKVNRAFEVQTGLKDVEGKRVSEVVPGMHEANPEQLEIYSRVARTGQSEQFETYAKLIDTWFSVSVYSNEPAHFVVAFANITERKKAEAEVRFNEQRFRSLVQATSEIVWDTPASGEFETEQPGWSAFTGQTFAEYGGTGWLSAIHADDQEETFRVWNAAVASRAIYKVEHRIRAKDKTYRHMLVRAVPILGEDGEIRQWIGIHTDMTTRKQAEESLVESRERLALATESARIGIWDWDIAGEKMIWDERMIALYGLQKGDFKGNVDDWQNALHPDDRARATNDVTDALKGTRDFNTQFRIVWPNGEVHLIEAQAVVQRAANGSPIRMTGANRDITETKKAEERLVEQAALLGATRDAIMTRDLDHRISFWNLGAERLYGWTAEEACGCNAQELLKMDAEKFSEAEQAVRTTGQWDGELQKTSKDGSIRTLEARWTMMRDSQGRPRSILSIDTDITERKKLEEQFLRAQRMESIGTLAGGIAHDLNNMLAPIIMSIELLKMKFEDPESQGLLTTIGSSAQRGADLVSQVLSFARGVEGRRMEVHIGHLLRDLEKLAKDTFHKNIQVCSRVPDDLWAVLGDPTQLHQVLLNLCVNARDAMPNGGTITLSAENLSLDAHYAGLYPDAGVGLYVALTVEDTGTGMSADTIEKIFDPFFTTKEIGKGTGLGLSTTLAIVQSHSGFLRVYSEVGAGTKFKIYLPANLEKSAAALAAAEIEMPRGHGELILVVDDEDSVRQITHQTLEAFGYRVVLAADGAEALAIYASHMTEIAAVLTDMMMPVMDGPAMIRVLLKLNPAVRIIAASGLTSNSQAMDQGVKHFLPKPYTAETMLRVLRQILTGE